MDARVIFKHEAHDFTPWLRQNIQLLADALGIEIEIEGIEVAVGDFAADLHGRDLVHDRPVVIENQLEPTNHDHLGKLLTYAAGLDVAVVVWIAPVFRDEHRQVIDWLNLHTDSAVDFFGVEIEFLRIDNSLPAPHFKVVSMPNEWTKATKSAAGAVVATEKVLRRKKFFEDVFERFKLQRPGLTSASRIGTQNWFGFGAGKAGFSFNWTFGANDKFRVDLWIHSSDGLTKQYFDALYAQRAEIEAKIGQPVIWHRKDDKKSSDLQVQRDGSIEDSDEELEALRDWAVGTMVKWTDVLRPLVLKLP